VSGTQGSNRPAHRSPRVGGATATGSLYERYKDALRRGHVAALRGRNDAAVDAYGEAATIAPDRALPHVSIGGIFARMDRLDEAVAAYERALDLAPRDEGALRGLAEVHIRTGRRIIAAATLDRLADALDAVGRLADATDSARRALELAESRDRRAQVEALVGRLRATPSNDEAGQRALDQALHLLQPEARPDEPDHAAGDVGDAAEPEPARESEADAAIEAPPAPEPILEPVGLGIALGAAAEAALHAGDLDGAHDGLLAAARAHRRAGRLVAAVDACYLAIGLAPADPDLHLLLVELFLDRGWRSEAADKLLLLGRLADLDGDQAVRDRLCALVTERMPDEPRVAELCA
jgi:tetratricopeptide (TPR) repeat protein